jgi:hypothetical protein
MTAQAILDELRPLGRESYKKVMRTHGVPEPFFGVKIEELKKSRNGSSATTRSRWRSTRRETTTRSISPD